MRKGNWLLLSTSCGLGVLLGSCCYRGYPLVPPSHPPAVGARALGKSQIKAAIWLAESLILISVLAGRIADFITEKACLVIGIIVSKGDSPPNFQRLTRSIFPLILSCHSHRCEEVISRETAATFCPFP